jgi:hypothetical protein
MKLVREHINEKFTKDYSDPIQDMGIGTMGMGNIKKGDIVEIIKPMTSEYTGPKDFELYFNVKSDPYLRPKINGVVLKTKRIGRKLELYITFFYDNDVIPTIKKKILSNGFKHYTINEKYPICHSVQSYKTWADHIKIIKKVNEAFTEDSDPIKDMEIGLVDKLNSMISNIWKQPTFLIYGEKIEITKNGGQFIIRFTIYNRSDIPYRVYNIESMLKETGLEKYLVFPGHVRKNLYYDISSCRYLIFDVKPGYQSLFKELNKKYVYIGK